MFLLEGPQERRTRKVLPRPELPWRSTVRASPASIAR